MNREIDALWKELKELSQRALEAETKAFTESEEALEDEDSVVISLQRRKIEMENWARQEKNARLISEKLNRVLLRHLREIKHVIDGNFDTV